MMRNCVFTFNFLPSFRRKIYFFNSKRFSHFLFSLSLLSVEQTSNMLPSHSLSCLPADPLIFGEYRFDHYLFSLTLFDFLFDLLIFDEYRFDHYLFISLYLAFYLNPLSLVNIDLIIIFLDAIASPSTYP